MQLKSALRWSLYDRALALLPFLLGVAIVAGGIWLGAGAFLDELAFGDPSDAGSPASVPLIAVGFVLGLAVWQIGRSTVRHHTMRKALENQIDDVVDEERIASTAASKVDDRIVDVENDVQQVSRKTTRIEQEVRGDELGSDAFDDEVGGTDAGGATPANAAAASSATGAGSDDAAESLDTPADTDDSGSSADDAPDAAADDAGQGSTASGDDAASGGDGAGDAADEAPGDASSDSGSGDEASSDDASGDDESEGDESGNDAAADDGFEWEGDADDGEYYRDT